MPRHVIIGFRWNSLPPTSSATRAEEFDLFFFLKEKNLSMICTEGGSRNTGGSTPSANYEETKQKHRGLLHPRERQEDLGRGWQGEGGDGHSSGDGTGDNIAERLPDTGESRI